MPNGYWIARRLPRKTSRSAPEITPWIRLPNFAINFCMALRSFWGFLLWKTNILPGRATPRSFLFFLAFFASWRLGERLLEIRHDRERHLPTDRRRRLSHPHHSRSA